MSDNPTLNIRDILSYLPHRPPFLLVDRVLKIIPGKTLRAIKNVTMNEPFFVGHFPERPVMPGVLIVEALAQAAGVLTLITTGENPQENLYFFASIDKVRFKRVVEPGDQLTLDVEILKMRQNLVKVSGVATVAKNVACSAEMMMVRAPKEQHGK
jgi:3-hydroxyacyl-[acyl-carrier-protein] dehydratase